MTYIHTVLTYIIDSIFPPSAEALLVRTMRPDDSRTLYQLTHQKKYVSLSSYHDPRIRALIHEAKFHNNTHACAILGALVAHYILLHMHEYDYIVPIPLSPARIRARGYNQVECILRTLNPSSLSIPIQTRLLTRTRNTAPQTSLAREARLHNIRGAFTCTQPELVRNARILLIDDVLTTGATLHEAAGTLELHSPMRVTCLALAH
jgi:ComF family protein